MTVVKNLFEYAHRVREDPSYGERAAAVSAERARSTDEAIHAFLFVRSEKDLVADMDEQRGRSEHLGLGELPLLGVPIAVKDVIAVEGVPRTVGSRALEPSLSGADGTVVRDVKRAGSIVVGVTNTDEFAYACTGNLSGRGATFNPYDKNRISGGSSSGSAAAVAAGIVPFAIGTDTGGSVRVPAAMCGVVGMKPTFGLLSTEGVFRVSETLDHVGILSGSVIDNALALSALTGKSDADGVAGIADCAMSGLRVGRFSESSVGYVHDDVRNALTAAWTLLEGMGLPCEDLNEDLIDEAVSIQRTILAFEAYQQHRDRLVQAGHLYVPAIAERLRSNSMVTLEDYEAACAARADMKLRFSKLFEKCDAIMLPTVPIAAVRQDETHVDTGDGMEPVGSLLTRFTGPANLLGLPAISIPIGWSPWGVPIGAQIMGPPNSERTLYRIAAKLEAAVDFASSDGALPTWYERVESALASTQTSRRRPRGGRQ